MDFKFKTLIDLLRYFKDEKTCYDFLESQIWHNGQPACPHCGSLHVYTRKNRSTNPAKAGVREYKCAEKGCSKNFTATVGTIFESSKLPLQTWFAAIWLCTTSSKGISSLNLSKQLGITQKSAWFVLSRIREMFKETAPHMLSGMVEVDETYVGGKLKNMTHKKRKAIGAKGANGNKTPVMGYVSRGGNLRLVAVHDRRELMYNVISNVSPEAVIYTDAAGLYTPIAHKFAGHEIIDHSKKEYARGSIHTNTIEGAFSQLDRMVIGVYHQVSPKHLQRYCNECSFRYNNRKELSVVKFAEGIRGVIKARITYKELTGK